MFILKDNCYISPFISKNIRVQRVVRLQGMIEKIAILH